MYKILYVRIWPIFLQDSCTRILYILYHNLAHKSGISCTKILHILYKYLTNIVQESCISCKIYCTRFTQYLARCILLRHDNLQMGRQLQWPQLHRRLSPLRGGYTRAIRSRVAGDRQIPRNRRNGNKVSNQRLGGMRGWWFAHPIKNKYIINGLTNRT